MYVNYYTDNQIQIANNVNLKNYLTEIGENLKPVGSEYKLIYCDSSGKHDSIMIKSSMWYDHKKAIGGKAIKFMQNFYNLDFHTSVQRLLDYASTTTTVQTAAPKSKMAQTTATAVENKGLFLPERNSTTNLVYKYLSDKRYINEDIIRYFMENQTIYEEKVYHNVVFVGVDENNEPKQANKRSIRTQFKQTCKNSDTRYSFSHFGKNEKLYVFESPIDMLSFITLYPENWQASSYLSLNGLYDKAMISALERYKNITEVVLCVDNDNAGNKATDRLTNILHKMGYRNVRRLAPEYKDWNEVLKAQHGEEALPAVPEDKSASTNSAEEYDV